MAVTCASDRGYVEPGDRDRRLAGRDSAGGRRQCHHRDRHRCGRPTGSDTLTVTVTSFVYYLAEGATGTFFDLELAIANPTLAGAGDRSLPRRTTARPCRRRSRCRRSRARPSLVDSLPGLETRPCRRSSRRPRAAARRRADDAVGRDRLRRAHREGDGRRADDLVLRRRIAGLLRHVSAARQPAARPPTRDRHVPASRAVARSCRTLSRCRRRRGPTCTPGDPRARRAVVRHASSTFTSRAWPSARCTSARPVLERRPRVGGRNAPSTSWFHAEGATGAFFDTFILLANPERRAGDVR